MNEQPPEYDVLILGSGLAGSLTAAILARHGAKVLLIDAAQHPRFAVGESTTPQTIGRLVSTLAIPFANRLAELPVHVPASILLDQQLESLAVSTSSFVSAKPTHV